MENNTREINPAKLGLNLDPTLARLPVSQKIKSIIVQKALESVIPECTINHTGEIFIATINRIKFIPKITKPNMNVKKVRTKKPGKSSKKVTARFVNNDALNEKIISPEINEANKQCEQILKDIRKFILKNASDLIEEETEIKAQRFHRNMIFFESVIKDGVLKITWKEGNTNDDNEHGSNSTNNSAD